VPSRAEPAAVPLPVVVARYPSLYEDRRALLAEAVKRYAGGECVREVGAATGKSYSMIREMLIVAGVERRGRGRSYGRQMTPRPGPERAADLVCRYLGGATVRALSEESGFGLGVVRQVLADVGIPVRRRGRPRRSRVRLSEADRARLADELARRYTNGESVAQLAALSGRPYGYVQRLLRESGVKPRMGGNKMAAAIARAPSAAEVAGLYTASGNIATVARETGLSYRVVRAKLEDAGTPIRRGSRRKPEAGAPVRGSRRRPARDWRSLGDGTANPFPEIEDSMQRRYGHDWPQVMGISPSD
jgi:transposase